MVTCSLFLLKCKKNNPHYSLNIIGQKTDKVEKEDKHQKTNLHKKLKLQNYTGTLQQPDIPKGINRDPDKGCTLVLKCTVFLPVRNAKQVYGHPRTIPTKIGS